MIPMPEMNANGSTETPLIRGARNFLAALRILSESNQPSPPDVTAFLAAHALEIGLKAFLLQSGWREDQIKGLGHSLNKAWLATVENGLNLPQTPPDWCEKLASAHTHPYLARYSRNNAGLVVPCQATLIECLGEVLDLVSDGIVRLGGVV